MNRLKAPSRKFSAGCMRSLLILLAFMGAAGCLRGPGGKSGWSGATGTEQHERLMWQAIHDKKWNEVENHLAATYKMQWRAEDSGQPIPDVAVRVVSVWQQLKHGWV